MHFTLRFSPGDETKLIISVSKKIAKRAVVRNTIKRRVRAIFKNLKPKFGTYLVIARKDSEKIRGEELQSEITR